MPIVKKRNWRTLELAEEEMVNFASIGGLEIDVLSVDSFQVSPTTNLAEQLSLTKSSLKPRKKKSPSRKTCIGDQNSSLPEICRVEPLDMSLWRGFKDRLCGEIIDGLSRLGFSKPSPIQESVINPACDGFDILAAAQTGSGKTLSFGIPIMNQILETKRVQNRATTRCLCVLPTRELALQVKEHLEAVCQSAIGVGVAVGGMSIEKQFRILSRKPDIVVGTPGRLAGLLGLSKSSDTDGSDQICADFKYHLCDNLSFLVLDEADRLLEQAHFRDLTQILQFIYTSIPVAESIQTFVLSATLPVESSELGRLVKRLRLKPAGQRFTIDLGRKDSDASVPKELTFKTMYCANEEDREAYLVYYLLKKMSGKIIVFVNAISYVYRLASLLPLCLPNGSRVVGIHSNLRQKDRLKKLDQFKAASQGLSVMVATDLAARGLDLPEVRAVVHLQPPRTPESLIHRSGRTARAGRSGECMMIVTPKMSFNWGKTVKQALKIDISSIETMDAVSVDINQVRAIHTLAAKIENETHRNKRDSKNSAWSKKTCDEADLWDSDNEDGKLSNGSDSDVFLGDDERSLAINKTKGRSNTKTDTSKQELSHLLSNPLPSKRS